MKKATMVWMLFLSASLVPHWAYGNEIYYRAPGLDVPHGSIAYMGSYYSPLKVHKTGSDTEFLAPKDKSLLPNDFFVADKSEAVSETNQALQEKASEMSVYLTPTDFNEAYQFALLQHVLDPAHYSYNPGIGQYCGNKPYILIVLVDFYAEFSSSVNFRGKQNGQTVDYRGRRSILENDQNVFRNKGRQAVVALEFFLVSSQDGSTLWQANLITTGNSFSSDNYYGLAKGLAGDALKNLMKF